MTSHFLCEINHFHLVRKNLRGKR